MVSTTSFTDRLGRVDELVLLWNSLRMSFCSVPPRCVQSMPRSRAMRQVHRPDHGRRTVDRLTHRHRLRPGCPRTGDACRRWCRWRRRSDRPRRPKAGRRESRPMSVGRSNAVESPVLALVPVAFSSRYLNRAFVSSAEPKPANCRIVQSRDRYIVGCTPRVKGYSPGVAILASARLGSLGSVVGTEPGP